MADDKVEIEVGANTKPARDEFSKFKTDVGAAADQLAPKFDRAAAAADSFGEKAVRGAKGTVVAATQAKIAIDALEHEVDQLRAKGENVDGAVAALNRLKAGYEANVAAAGRARAAAADVSDQLKGATARAGEFQGQVTTLSEAMAVKFPAAADAIVGVVAALGTFKLAFSETRQFVQFVRSEFGVDIDQFVKDSVTGWLLLYDDLIEKTPQVVESQQQLDNMIKILDAHGVQHTATVESITQAYANFGQALRDAQGIAQAADDSFQSLVERGAGISVDKLNAKIFALLATVSDFKGDFAALKSSAIFPEFVKEAREVEDTLARFGDAFRRTLDGAALDEFNANAETFQDSVRVKLKGSLDDASLSADVFVAKNKALSASLAETAAAATTAAQKYDEAQAKFTGKAPGQSGDTAKEKKIAADRKELEGLEALGVRTAEQTIRYNELKDALFGMSESAMEGSASFLGLSDAAGLASERQGELNAKTAEYNRQQNATIDASVAASDAYYRNAQAQALLADTSHGAAVQVSEDGKTIQNTADENTVAIGRTADGMVELSNAAAKAENSVKWERGADGVMRVSNAAEEAAANVAKVGDGSTFASKYLEEVGRIAEEAIDGKLNPALQETERIQTRVRDLTLEISQLMSGMGGPG